MSDNDIINALKYCTSRSFKNNACLECPLQDEDCGMGNELKKLALNLINRQKAEIGRLTLENRKLTDTNNALNYQVDTWSPSEAIKGFSEKLKTELTTGMAVMRVSTLDVIDSLVKEMTEVQHD